MHIIRSDIPNYASNNRLKATPEEYKAAAEGTLSYFGTYDVDPSGKVLTMKIAGSSFPNFRGQTQKREIALKGDELIITNSSGASGGTAVTTWKHAK
ncbi:MAG TPA: lipocalin-like domain-containing protein [Alphaproteobacteria bacterium]|nr:lipocalin-like domain-containing protein [Alphaproteobacteria bacterium]